MNTGAIWIILLTMAGFLSAGVPEEETYARGMDAYANEQWLLAIQEFEAVLRSGYEAEVLYYNLGNTYYRAGHVAGAVWAYEKALILNANDEDARYNLAIANLRVKDRIEIPALPFYIRLYRGIRESFTTGEWMRWISITLFLVASFYALSRFLQRAWLAWPIIPGTILALLLFLITMDRITIARRTQEGVVYNPIAVIYSAPSERSTKLFQIHEGLKVTITEKSDDWYQIELLDGKSGWLPADQLRPL
jgi:tetratricopeptide (TPR) repeat protein